MIGGKVTYNRGYGLEESNEKKGFYIIKVSVTVLFSVVVYCCK